MSHSKFTKEVLPLMRHLESVCVCFLSGRGETTGNTEITSRKAYNYIVDKEWPE